MKLEIVGGNRVMATAENLNEGILLMRFVEQSITELPAEKKEESKTRKKYTRRKGVGGAYEDDLTLAPIFLLEIGETHMIRTDEWKRSGDVSSVMFGLGQKTNKKFATKKVHGGWNVTRLISVKYKGLAYNPTPVKPSWL